MTVRLLTEHHLEFLSLKWSCTGSSESTLVKMPHCWKSHAMAQIYFAVSDYPFSFWITGKQVLWQTVKTDEMPHNVTFHQGLHCKNRKQIFMTEMHLNSEISTCHPLKSKMGNSILILSTCMGKSIIMKRG